MGLEFCAVASNYCSKKKLISGKISDSSSSEWRALGWEINTLCSEMWTERLMPKASTLITGCNGTVSAIIPTNKLTGSTSS